MAKQFFSLKTSGIWRRSFATLTSKNVTGVFLNYNKGTPERAALEDELAALASNQCLVPMIIGCEKIYTGNHQYQRMPHEKEHNVAQYSFATHEHIEQAIARSVGEQEAWSAKPVMERVKIWQHCADIIENQLRHKLNAALMLGQAKTHRQAEEDTCCLLNMLRNSAAYLQHAATQQPEQQVTNLRTMYNMRPLDGFVVAISPFNMTSLAANLALEPALMGNCVLWKPACNAVLSNYIVLQAMEEAGLPHGVISFITSNASVFLDTVCKSPHLAGINFGGRNTTFKHIWQYVARNIESYNNFPRMCAQCGGKNFHFVHESADKEMAVRKTAYAAFNYSGQNCNSCTRMYVPWSLWPSMLQMLKRKLRKLKLREPTDFTAFTSAVINRTAYERIARFLLIAKDNPETDIVIGGYHHDTSGYFVEPTVVVCKDPMDPLMTEDIMGPVLSVYVYDNNQLQETLNLAANTTNTAYCGAVFTSSRNDIWSVLKQLRMGASNLYVNECCCGCPLGHVPFAGGRLSSTNDQFNEAGALMRWNCQQLIEEKFRND